MPTVVTINRPDVVALIETAANRLTGGNKTEAVALAMRRLLELEVRKGSLFGRHRGSVTINLPRRHARVPITTSQAS